MDFYIHIDDFEKMFESPYNGETYTIIGPSKSSNCNHKVAILENFVWIKASSHNKVYEN